MDIFDEDSSDDDDDNNNKDTTTQSKEKKTTMDSGTDSEEESKKDDDDPKRTIVMDEDDVDDEGPVIEESKEDENEKKKKNSDDEDSGAEFNEKEAAIVGSAAPPKKIKKQRNIIKSNTMTVIESSRPKNDVSLHITKLPNLVGIQPEAFEHNTYSTQEEEKDYNGYVHNMIRWRYKKNMSDEYMNNGMNKIERESNTRLVKWEDGSMTLHVGSETFVCDQIPSAKAPKVTAGGNFKNGYLYLSQKATFRATATGDEEMEETDGGTVLECMGGIVSKITPRPSSLQSDSHKALTMAVRQRVLKRSKIVEYVTQEDPEKAKQDRIRQNSDLNKAKLSKRKSSEYTHYRARRGMNRDYLEEDNYDSTNLAHIKRGNDDYGESSEDDDNFKGDYKTTREKLRKRKEQQKQQEKEREESLSEASSDDDAELVGAEDSDEEQVHTHKKNKSSQSRKRAAILDEEESD